MGLLENGRGEAETYEYSTRHGYGSINPHNLLC